MTTQGSGETDTAVHVGSQLVEAGETVATAESITGGLVAKRLTDVPGASEYVHGGMITYAYDAKRTMLGVSRETLDATGAVSEQTAVEMAQGIRDRTDTSWGVAVTGIAGPGGGSAAKPVGTVYIAIAYAAPWGSNASYATATGYHFDGDRETIRLQAAERALLELAAAMDEQTKEDQ